MLISFPLQQYLRERASILRYTYIASFVSVAAQRANASPFHVRSVHIKLHDSNTLLKKKNQNQNKKMELLNALTIPRFYATPLIYLEPG